MILVLLGTFPTDFKRPLLEIDKLCADGTITEEVIVQNGYTTIDSKYLTLKPFLPINELIELYKQARIIISQAGTGSLIKGIKLNKKIIAIPRLAKYGEVVDDHQLEILEEFTKLNYILPWREDVSLKECLVAIESFHPEKYVSQKETIINYLTEYIDSL